MTYRKSWKIYIAVFIYLTARTSAADCSDSALDANANVNKALLVGTGTVNEEYCIYKMNCDEDYTLSPADPNRQCICDINDSNCAYDGTQHTCTANPIQCQQLTLPANAEPTEPLSATNPPGSSVKLTCGAGKEIVNVSIACSSEFAWNEISFECESDPTTVGDTLKKMIDDYPAYMIALFGVIAIFLIIITVLVILLVVMKRTMSKFTNTSSKGYHLGTQTSEVLENEAHYDHRESPFTGKKEDLNERMMKRPGDENEMIDDLYEQREKVGTRNGAYNGRIYPRRISLNQQSSLDREDSFWALKLSART